MKKDEIIIQTAKENFTWCKNIADETVKTLNNLKESEESIVVTFEDATHYEQVGVLVNEGYISKEFRDYSITEKGEKLLESIEMYEADPKKYTKLVETDLSKMVVIEYKKHDEVNNIICNESAAFDVESDGLPVIVVNEESYANLIHRTKGQHWVHYLGESGRNLVRQKKLTKFYVEDENTSRRYLYMVPKK
jgi:hypothetical protein